MDIWKYKGIIIDLRFWPARIIEENVYIYIYVCMCVYMPLNRKAVETREIMEYTILESIEVLRSLEISPDLPHKKGFITCSSGPHIRDIGLQFSGFHDNLMNLYHLYAPMKHIPATTMHETFYNLMWNKGLLWQKFSMQENTQSHAEVLNDTDKGRVSK